VVSLDHSLDNNQSYTFLSIIVGYAYALKRIMVRLDGNIVGLGVVSGGASMRDRIPFLTAFMSNYERSLKVSLFTIVICGSILYGHPSLDLYQATILWGICIAVGLTVVVCVTIVHRLLRHGETRLVNSRIPFLAAFMRNHGRSLKISLFSIISCGSILYLDPALDRYQATILWGMFIAGGLTVVVVVNSVYRILKYGITRLVNKKKGIDFINGLDKLGLFVLFDSVEYDRDVSQIRFRNATIFQTLCDLNIIAKKETRAGDVRSSRYFVTDWAKARILKRLFGDTKANR